MKNQLKLELWLFLHDTELTNAVITMNCNISCCINRVFPFIFLSAIAVINYQYVILKAFYPLVLIFYHHISSAYIFTFLYTNVSDTRGNIIFIQLLCSTMTINLTQFDCLSRYCLLAHERFHRYCPIIIYEDISLLHKRHIYNKAVFFYLYFTYIFHLLSKSEYIEIKTL